MNFYGVVFFAIGIKSATCLSVMRELRLFVETDYRRDSRSCPCKYPTRGTAMVFHAIQGDFVLAPK
jgi:hypothetical protein